MLTLPPPSFMLCNVAMILFETDAILADLRVADHARTTTTVEVSTPPAPRSSATLVAHPSKDELILFAGMGMPTLPSGCTFNRVAKLLH
jgi:hypothetical protein